DGQADLSEQIGRLVRERPYGVLCTQSQSQPYGSLVALGASDDLTAFVFATPTATRKYRVLSECDHVALVIESRAGTPGELMDVEAGPGLCAGLVDGQVDPDRWELRRSDGTTVAWHPGHRDEQAAPSPLL